MPRVLLTNTVLARPLPLVCVVTGRTDDVELRTVHVPRVVERRFDPEAVLLYVHRDRVRVESVELPFHRGEHARGRRQLYLAYAAGLAAGVVLIPTLLWLIMEAFDRHRVMEPALILGGALVGLLALSRLSRRWPAVVSATQFAVELDLPSAEAAEAFRRHALAIEREELMARHRRRRRAA